jgi:hypothetical protein
MGPPNLTSRRSRLGAGHYLNEQGPVSPHPVIEHSTPPGTRFVRADVQAMALSPYIERIRGLMTDLDLRGLVIG